MNIAQTIAKFIKDGLAALSESEKQLLTDNINLMSVSQKEKFQKAISEIKKEEEEEEENEEGEDGINEKLLKEMISKTVNDEVLSKVDGIANQLVEKFFSGAKEQRKKAIDTGAKVEDPGRETTREFMKALLHNDKEKLVELSKKTTTFNQATDNARGGYLVPDELRAEVLRVAEKQYGLARREFKYLPFSGPGDERKIPTLASSVSVNWVNEGSAKTSTNPTFGLVTQTLKKLAAIVPMTEEILEDSLINITQLVAELFAEAVSKEEDTQFFNGTGSPWTGILNNGSVGSVSLAATLGMADVTFEKLVDMQDACPSGALIGAKYYMHRHVLSYLRKLRADAVSSNDKKGMFLLPPTKADLEDILGFPIELSDALPSKTLTGVNKPFVIFGNLKMAAIFGDKQQIRAKLLDQATITDGDGQTTLNLAEQDMIALRLEERVGYVLALPTAVVVLKTGPSS